MARPPGDESCRAGVPTGEDLPTATIFFEKSDIIDPGQGGPRAIR